MQRHLLAELRPARHLLWLPPGDNIVYDVPSTDTFNITTASGWQRFYVEGSGPTAGLLWYCGDIRHWFDSEGFAGYSGAGYNDTLAPVRLLARLTLCSFTSGVKHTVSRQAAPCAASVPVADGQLRDILHAAERVERRPEAVPWADPAGVVQRVCTCCKQPQHAP
jgi:hypothetical protein